MGYTTRDMDEHPMMDALSEIDRAADAARAAAGRLLQMADATMSQDAPVEVRGKLIAAWQVAHRATQELDTLSHAAFDAIERDIGNRRGDEMDRARDHAIDLADGIFAALTGGKP